MLYQMADRLGDSHIGYVRNPPQINISYFHKAIFHISPYTYIFQQAMFVANEIVTTLQDSDSVANVTWVDNI